MFVDNGNQLKNYGIQLQNMGMEIQNFGIQMKNNIMQNIGNQIQIQDIGNQIQNIGAQISNIAIQIFNVGTQVSNIIMNQYNVNLMNQNDLMNTCMMNGINEEIINDNFDSIKMNFLFETVSGRTNNIAMNPNRTVEDLLKLYLNKMGLNLVDVQKKNIFFVYNGETIDIKEKRKIKEFFLSCNSTQRIIVENF